MSKIAVVYWSGTGNTEAMAQAVAGGAEAGGSEVTTFTAGEFSADKVAEFDAIAFGCPAMGGEVLEESEFEPMFESCNITGKKLALFGSYGWGDGEWMRNWEQSCTDKGATLVCDSVICNDAPDDAALESCKALGKALTAQ
jgi:flavodoxin short chain